MKTKEELLEDLAKLGVDPSKRPRKPRSDAGEIRGEYKPRNDKGKLRGSYINTAAKYKAVYERMLASHKTGSGDGEDSITRDPNDIFPPNMNHYTRVVAGKDRIYYSNVLRPAHLEQARWRWLMAEYAADPDKWRAHIAKWYFIREEEIEQWTYTEWAWAYVNHIASAENRLTDLPQLLQYEYYINGWYNGRAVFDERGDIVWPK